MFVRGDNFNCDGFAVREGNLKRVRRSMFLCVGNMIEETGSMQ